MVDNLNKTTFHKTSEQDSLYDDLEKKPVGQILREINEEDKKVAYSVEKALPNIETLVDVVVEKMSAGGRLFYIGAGTSGRLGILDASECPPTFGVNYDRVIGLIAGGDAAIRKAVEDAEDSLTRSWGDLREYGIDEKDVLVGIAASGTTPYVVSAVRIARKHGIATGCITVNRDSPLHLAAEYPVVVHVGPEYVTGSSRMKAGTAQKMVLNMISTATMIKLGKVKGNKMVDMQLTNRKLVERGTRIIMKELKLGYDEAKSLLLEYGSVRKVLNNNMQ